MDELSNCCTSIKLPKLPPEFGLVCIIDMAFGSLLLAAFAAAAAAATADGAR